MDQNNQLIIELPERVADCVPKDRSLRWCHALFHALKPLLEYKLQDGSDAVHVLVASGYRLVSDLAGLFEDQIGSSGYIADCEEPKFVCRITCKTSRHSYAGVYMFYVNDFQDGGSRAKKKFEKIMQRIREHAFPHDPPVVVQGFVESLSDC